MLKLLKLLTILILWNVIRLNLRNEAFHLHMGELRDMFSYINEDRNSTKQSTLSTLRSLQDMRDFCSP